MEKPEALHDQHLEYLDTLRESGVTNMFGAAPFLKAEFSELSKQDARQILQYWMKTFSDRHPEG